jgi:hypothetical protein
VAKKRLLIKVYVEVAGGKPIELESASFDVEQLLEQQRFIQMDKDGAKSEVTPEILDTVLGAIGQLEWPDDEPDEDEEPEDDEDDDEG